MRARQVESKISAVIALRIVTIFTVCIVAFVCLGLGTTAHAKATIAKPKSVSAAAGGSAFTVKATWSSAVKPTKAQVRYSTKKTMKSAKTKTYKVTASQLSARKLSKTITATAGKKYYVQVRLYRGGKYSPWSAKKSVTTGYKITYKLNGGKQASGQQSYYVKAKKYILKTPTRAGYTFGGWYTNSSLKAKYKVTSIKKGSTGAKTLHAKWTAKTYAITYNANGGTLPSGARATYNITTATFTLPTPTRTGYTFEGWQYGTKRIKKVTKGTTGNLSLKAVWSPNTYTITYQYGDDVVMPASYGKYFAVTTPAVLPTPTREGYEFIGWYDEDGDKYTGIVTYSTVGARDLTLTARWGIAAVDDPETPQLPEEPLVTMEAVREAATCEEGDGHVHEMADGYVITEAATCAETGTKARYCKYCGTTYAGTEQEIPMIDHTWEQVIIHHDAVYKTVHDITVDASLDQCQCGEIFYTTNELDAHQMSYALAGISGHSSSSTLTNYIQGATYTYDDGEDPSTVIPYQYYLITSDVTRSVLVTDEYDEITERCAVCGILKSEL
ncbi:InlB B-repeat-containing protein [bacterium 210820-DFI.6.37]|nr:InlB B-repeat-containing protein [bacterium 210820-DFI.6.37]